MNLRTIKPMNLVTAAAFAAPLVVVQVTRLMTGGGPSQAAAGTASDPPGTVEPAPSAGVPALKPAQKAAAAHLAELRGGAMAFRSPFGRGVTAALVTPAPVEEPRVEPAHVAAAEPAVIPAEVRGLFLGSMMRNEKGPFAVISGKVRTQGDAVLPGWRVTRIDPERRSVELTHDDGAKATLSRP